MFCVAVCDSEVTYFEQIKKFCENVQEKDFVLEYYPSGEALMEEIEHVNVLFLAIELPGISGFEVRDLVQDLEYKCVIIFETKHPERMATAFGTAVAGFLGKPLTEERFLEQFHPVMHSLRKKERVLIRSNGREITLYKREITRIEADQHYTDVKTESGSFFSEKSIGDWEELLDNQMFFRIHRSTIINFFHVRAIQDKILFGNGEKIAVPKRKKKEIIEAYKRYLLECPAERDYFVSTRNI